MALLPGQPPSADDVAPRGTKAWRQAVNARRQWAGDQLWQAQANQNLNLSDPTALSNYLATLGYTDEVGGGRHGRNLFMGNLASEGFGMGPRGISHALEAYMPDWKWSRDRQVQNGKLTPAEADARWVPGLGGPVASGSGFGPLATGLTAPPPAFAPTQDPYALAQEELRKRKQGGLTLGSLAGGF